MMTPETDAFAVSPDDDDCCDVLGLLYDNCEPPFYVAPVVDGVAHSQ